ncbi:MAG: hypothetical protein IH594_18685, partial [Bacteroidales bacterium]|nr:hypothetical protein [Bacteroidales bacterium]
ISSGNKNIFIGESAGEHISTASDNICLGYQAGNGRNGNGNLFFGWFSGYSWNGFGNDNIMMGSRAGYKFGAENSRCIFLGRYSGYNTDENDNIYIGPEFTGSNASGTKNIFFGFEVGKNWVGSNTLLIDNKNDNASPFIKGNMEDDQLEINGSLTVNGPVHQQSANIESTLNLEELTEFPPNPVEGDMIYLNDTLRFYNGVVWKNLW